MFNEQGCRIRAKIAPTTLLRCTIFGAGLCNSAQARERRDSLVMAIKRTEKACIGRRNCAGQCQCSLVPQAFR
jgi:hypothetical protein